MKIVFAVSAMESGGAERVVSLLSNELANRGHVVVILMISTNKKKCFYTLDNKVTLMPLLTNETISCSYFKRVKLLRSCCLSLSPDIVISFLPHVCIYTYFALRKSKIPYILSERNDPHQYNFIYKLLLKISFNSADGCVFQTSDCLKWYRKNKNKKTDRVIYNPVNLKPISTLNKKDRKDNVLYVGRFDKQKNYKLLLDSFSLFHLKHPTFLLDVYGGGPDKEIFFNYAKKLGIINNVNYHGKDSNWFDKEFNSSIFVSTSLFEGMPNSLLEAASLNIPCVATDCPIGGSKELSNIYENIFIAKNKCKPIEFASTMEKALCYKGVLLHSKKEVSLSYIADQWLELINDILLGERHE